MINTSMESNNQKSMFLPNLDISRIKAQQAARSARDKRAATKKARPPPPSMFPSKLYQMVEDAETNGRESIVGWQAEGKAFLVRKPDQFVQEILPLYFRQTQYRSFQRQLNTYGFHRMTSGPYRGAYHHPCFIRGQPELLKNLSRSTAEQIGHCTLLMPPVPRGPAHTGKLAFPIGSSGPEAKAPMLSGRHSWQGSFPATALHAQESNNEMYCEPISSQTMPTEKLAPVLPDFASSSNTSAGSARRRSGRCSFNGKNFFILENEAKVGRSTSLSDLRRSSRLSILAMLDMDIDLFDEEDNAKPPPPPPSSGTRSRTL